MLHIKAVPVQHHKWLESEVEMREKKEMFDSYPDVVNAKQLCEVLGGIGSKSSYRLLHNGSIQFLKIGKAFRIPKSSVIAFIKGN